MPLSLTQRIVFAFVSPAVAADMETHSRAWKLRCGRCEHRVSIWEMGGIRYKAYGNSRMFLRCRNCRQFSWQFLAKDPA